jgi:hypothetical protein
VLHGGEIRVGRHPRDDGPANSIAHEKCDRLCAAQNRQNIAFNQVAGGARRAHADDPVVDKRV